jgi:hypothetical protein
MTKRSARALLTVPAAAALLGVTAAVAAATWTVRPGGAVTATTGPVVIKDASTGSLVTCSSATIKATLKAGTGLPGAGIGSLSSVALGTCTGPLGITFTMKLNHLPYRLSATSYHASTGTTTGKITGIHGNFTGPSCSYVLDGTGASMDDGTIDVTYVNGSHKLKLLPSGGNLHVYKLLGCGFLGGIHNDDHMTFSATGTVTPSQTITSP